MQNIQKKTAFYDIYHRKNKKFFKSINDNNFTYFEHLREINKILTYFPGTKIKILDIGCGVGTLAFYFAKKGHKVIGIDISSDAIKICNSYKQFAKLSNVDFIKLDAEQLIRSKEKFDLIICTEVIEHLDDDLLFLKTIRSKLTKNGFLFLSTPSLHAPLYQMGFLDKFDKEVGHLRRYSDSRLKKLFKMSNFSRFKIKKNESFIRNGLFMVKPLGFLIKFIRGPLVPIFHKVDSVIMYCTGECDLFVTAQK